MAKPLTGRIALVTGASRGVGRAVALRLAADGAAVAINYRREAEAAAEVVAQIEAAGGTARAYQAPVDALAAVETMLAGIAADLGTVDLLVSNAGISSGGRNICSTPDEEYLTVMKVHALGPVAIIKRLLPGMRERPRGDVVVISSSVTDSYPRNSAPYTMAKSAVEAAVRTLAREERRHAIRANIIAPGLVDTDMGGCWPASSAVTSPNCARRIPSAASARRRTSPA